MEGCCFQDSWANSQAVVWIEMVLCTHIHHILSWPVFVRAAGNHRWLPDAAGVSLVTRPSWRHKAAPANAVPRSRGDIALRMKLLGKRLKHAGGE